MLTDIGLAALIQLTKLRLCQPDSFILKPDIKIMYNNLRKLKRAKKKT